MGRLIRAQTGTAESLETVDVATLPRGTIRSSPEELGPSPGGKLRSLHRVDLSSPIRRRVRDTEVLFSTYTVQILGKRIPRNHTYK
jgi:hypothetical protein